MLPEHETFLLEHVKQMGFFFIIDRLKDAFPDLSHDKACAIYDEFKTKYAEDGTMKAADTQLKKVGQQIGGELEKQLDKMLRKQG